MGLFNLTWAIQAEKLLPPVLRARMFQDSGTGEFLVGDPSNQYTEYIVVSAPGHWKETPTLGVAIYKYLNGRESPQVIQRAIKLHMEADVFSKPVIDISEFQKSGIININSVTVDTNV